MRQEWFIHRRDMAIALFRLVVIASFSDVRSIEFPDARSRFDAALTVWMIEPAWMAHLVRGRCVFTVTIDSSNDGLMNIGPGGGILICDRTDDSLSQTR
jgi:hypothetical protein